uniref:transcription factor bHLH128-like n=1 Tax=Erigeron canadensis TaxID=72917 RepID=UPI001CB8C682|nr:transcription factor bHLH128-like [Erigeron canadensis]
MYPNSNNSSSSSASHPSRDPNNNHNIIDNNNGNNNNNNNSNGGIIGLARYRSAPVSFLNNAVDSVIINGQSGGHQQQQLPQHNNNNTGNHMVGMPTRFFSPAPPPHTTTSSLQAVDDDDRLQKTTPFRLNEFATAFNALKGGTTTQTPSPLFRHGSSPAGFLNTLVSSTTPSGTGGSRLSSQLSFTGTSSCFSQISEESDIVNSLVFSSSSPHNKRAKTNTTTNGLNITETELNFGLSESALEAATMEKMMDLPHDSVPCKIRAKRGCATHPRSIAERERRTRISGKLKKLQDLVPNMDKQTSYSDMLDLAVQHIKGLQTHVQSLREELQNCSCGCKPN